ncbi:MAG TPA: creatininase [Clostridiales bacterium]|nr:creatininase [Clostridiales bacterium]
MRRRGRLPVPQNILLEEMTWPEIEQALSEGWTTCVIAAGSVEQHGPHLPLITDTLLGQAVALRLARKLGRSLAAPAIRPGISEHHMAFPGSLTLDAKLFSDLVQAYCLSLARHGFTELVVFSSHGGNFGALADLAPGLARTLGEKVRTRVVGLDHSTLADRFMAPLTPFDIEPGAAGSHAGLSETSQVLAVRPELVRADRLAAGYTGEVGPDLIPRGLKAYTENGVLGDARRARAEYGEALLEAWADWLREEVQASRQADLTP